MKAKLEALLRRLRLFTLGTARSLLLDYVAAAEDASDVPASCKFHAYHALLFSHHSASELTKSKAASFLASSSYVMSWHSQDEESQIPKTQPAPRFRWMRRQQQGDNKILLQDGKTPSIPLGAIFRAVQRQRVTVMNWLRRADREDIDGLLSRMTGVSLRKGRMRAEKNWEVASKKVVDCRQQFESAHPYRAGTDVYQKVSFPGAHHVSLFFDVRCRTELEHDYVTIYKDESCTAFWGDRERLSGAAEEGAWPGAGGRPPLIIPADTFVLHFHSDEENEDWGFKLVAVAPIDSAKAVALNATFPRAEGVQWPLRHCQKALAACNNVLEDAKEYLVSHGERLDVEAEAEEKAEREAEEKARLENMAKDINGLFRDPSGVVEVNVQTAEVRSGPCPWRRWCWWCGVGGGGGGWARAVVGSACLDPPLWPVLAAPTGVRPEPHADAGAGRHRDARAVPRRVRHVGAAVQHHREQGAPAVDEDQ